MKKIILLFAALGLSVMMYATPSTTISVTGVTVGGLATAVTNAGGSLTTVTNLTVTGIIDARDFKSMRDDMTALTTIDLSEASIAAYSGTGGTDNASSASYAVNAIPQYAFFNVSTYTSKTNLKNIVLPKNIVSIGRNAFSFCSGLTSISFPNTLVTIESSAFEGCSGITSATFEPNSSLTSIGNSAIYNCTALTSFSIPATVTTISSGALQRGLNLTSIYAYSTTPVLFSATSSTDVFLDIDKTTCILYVPTSAAKVLYAASPQWADFTNIQIMSTVGVGNEMTTSFKVSTLNKQAIISGLRLGANLGVYNLQGLAIYNKKTTAETERVNLPTHGVYVVKVGNESVKVVY
jgi:hypothetical protein